MLEGRELVPGPVPAQVLLPSFCARTALVSAPPALPAPCSLWPEGATPRLDPVGRWLQASCALPSRSDSVSQGGFHGKAFRSLLMPAILFTPQCPPQGHSRDGRAQSGSQLAAGFLSRTCRPFLQRNLFGDTHTFLLDPHLPEPQL